MTDNNVKLRKLKRVLIKEELFELTGNANHAIVLNQMIYWSERTKEAKKFLEEEMNRARQYPDGTSESKEDMLEAISSGWIYKKAEEMIEDCMLKMTRPTMQKILDNLVENKWMRKRNNPKYKWDKTFQYRVDLYQIQKDLMKIGYVLEGYNIAIEEKNEDLPSIDNNLPSMDNNLPSMDNNLPSMDNNLPSIDNNLPAIPEITTETTISKITLETTIPNSNKEEEEEENIVDPIYFEPLKNFLKEKKLNAATIDLTIAKCHEMGITMFPYEAIEKQYDHMMEKESNSQKGMGERIYDFPLYFADGLKKITENYVAAQTHTNHQEIMKVALSVNAVPKVPFYNWLEERE